MGDPWSRINGPVLDQAHDTRKVCR
jgi:hypothetical protein